MFSTCIFCNKSLGRNESLESFPVGERIAFDAERGRLWVVCRHCERWNLSPLEERWEAMEQAEKLYRDTRRRVSTDNIGLARLPEGTTLIRIGAPQRPEFAAWRYGDQFGRRRNRALMVAAGSIGAVAAVTAGGVAAGASIAAFSGMLVNIGRIAVHGQPGAVVARVRTLEHGLVAVQRRHLGESSIGTEDGDLTLRLRFKNGETTLRGLEAERVAALVLPKVNRFGGRRQDVSSAVRQIEEAGDSTRFLLRSAALGAVRARDAEKGTLWKENRFFKKGLYALPTPQRLALEMALHEEAERRALEGELVELETAWREAEEIAAIADNLLLPSSVQTTFGKLKGDD